MICEVSGRLLLRLFQTESGREKAWPKVNCLPFNVDGFCLSNMQSGQLCWVEKVNIVAEAFDYLESRVEEIQPLLFEPLQLRAVLHSFCGRGRRHRGCFFVVRVDWMCRV